MNKKPIVIGESGQRIPFTYYQLLNAKMCLSLMTKGLKFRGVRLIDMRTSLHLKSKTTAACLDEVEGLIEKYKEEIMPLLKPSER